MSIRHRCGAGPPECAIKGVTAPSPIAGPEIRKALKEIAVMATGPGGRRIGLLLERGGMMPTQEAVPVPTPRREEDQKTVRGTVYRSHCRSGRDGDVRPRHAG